MNISTVILGNKIIVDSYHFTLSLACSSDRLKDFARIFNALGNAIKNLQKYYNGPPEKILTSQREFPYPNYFTMLYHGIQGQKIYFKYLHDLEFHPLVFVVEILEHLQGLPQRLFVKFTKQYPKDIHQACADANIAPTLYGFEKLPGGWFMVVMAHMTGFYALSDSNSSITAYISEELWNVLRKLHNLGYVHGDLRKENILVCKEDAKVNVVFIDWDWAGVAGEVCYPISINPAIYQHPTAKLYNPSLLLWGMMNLCSKIFVLLITL